MSKDYVGKIAVVNHDSYPRVGEYVIVRQTPHVAYGVSTLGGYGSHEIKAFNLVGEKPAQFVSVAEDDESVRELADELEYFADTTKRGEKTNWVGSVYSGARTNARLLRCLLSSKKEIAAVEDKKTLSLAGVEVTITVKR